MKKQPAKINYFFKGGYVELWKTIKATFKNLWEDICDAFEDVVEGFLSFWECFLPAIGGILTFEFEWDEIWDSIVAVCVFSFSLGKLLFILVITTGLCTLLSLTYAIVLLSVMFVAYIIFTFLVLADAIYRLIKRISSNCPSCQDHFSLPHYICPDCGAVHTKLCPSKYGIWKRTCECGCKLPTTFFNGREKLEAHCPNCGHNIKDGGKHVDICIPVVGGASSGKTCFIHQAITTLGKSAAQYGLEYEYSPTATDDFEENMNNLSNGYLPEKTNDMRLKYYQFYMNNAGSQVKNLISLCDVGGEVYSDSNALGEQIGYKYANAFLMVVDPLSVTSFREELEKQAFNSVEYGSSSESVDAIASMLISTLENMFCIGSKDMLKTNVAVVFSKGDIPGLSEKIGDTAVTNYMLDHPGVSRLDAQNAVCEAFLVEYDEVNFLNSLKSKFKTVQFFTSSALGHNANGTAFEAHGVEAPIVWLLEKTGVHTAANK